MSTENSGEKVIEIVQAWTSMVAEGIDLGLNSFRQEGT
jgi:hypothetical protein